MKILILFACCLLLTSLAYAQNGVLESQRLISTPFGLPIKINSQGQVSFFTGNNNLVVGPVFQVGYSKTHSHYVKPVPQDEFMYARIIDSMGWLDIKRVRYELGAGLSTIIQKTVSLGVAPYKGAILMMIRNKRSREVETSDNLVLPRRLNTMRNWSTGDTGIYQTYGGIQAFAGAGIGVVNLVSGSIGFQNQFIVEIKKISSQEIVLSMSEENLNRGSVSIGPMVAKATVSMFKGKRFTAEFTLNLNNPEHEELFALGINGRVNELQTKLPARLQKIIWKGLDQSAYFGIPWVAGRTLNEGHYSFVINGEHTFLDVMGKRNSGVLIPLGIHQKFAFHNSDNISLFWTTEMDKVSPKAIENNFIDYGRAMGAKGFTKKIPELDSFGFVNAQIGIVFTRSDFARMKGLNEMDLEHHFRVRCEGVNIDCQVMRNYRLILAKFHSSLKKPWSSMRREMGQLLLEEPALIYAIHKTMNQTRQVYFKFLNNRFQSLEGKVPLVF